MYSKKKHVNIKKRYLVKKAKNSSYTPELNAFVMFYKDEKRMGSQQHPPSSAASVASLRDATLKIFAAS